MIKSVKRSTEIIFIIIAIAVILEFIFIRGMFSGPIMMILITTTALCMGYFAFM